MKKTFVLLVATFLTSLGALAQTAEGFYLSKVGAKAEYAITPQGSLNPDYLAKEVTKAEPLEGGKNLITNFTITLNKKKKPDKTFTFKNKGIHTTTTIEPDGSYTIGDLFFGVINRSQESSGFRMKVPAEMKVGDKLEGGTCVSKIKDLTGKWGEVSTTYSNLEVVKEEDMTTSAGTFHCFVVKGTCTVNFQMKKHTRNYSYEVEYWFAKGVGPVFIKTDSYIGSYLGTPYTFHLTSLSM